MKKKFYIIIFSFLLFIFFGGYLISQNHNNKFSKYIKDNTPSEFKQFLKNTIFSLPLKLREESEVAKLYEKTITENIKLQKENKILKNKLNLGKYERKKINEKYISETIVIPYDLKKKFEFNKSRGYLETYDDKLIVVNVSGEIIYFEKSIFDSQKTEFKNIKSNLNTENLFDGSLVWTGIKDVKRVKNKLYISLTHEIEPKCYNTSLFVAEINFNYLNFEEVFKSKECAKIEKRVEYFAYFNGHQTGGRIENLNNKIILTIGDYNSWEFPQKDDSDFGKILEIDPQNKIYRYISKGHRNQQGLEIFSTNDKTLISTEHGPKGGDEINIINLNENFKVNNYGWPISSYGNHYDVVPINSYTKKYAPLNKNHQSYNFIEPSFYFEKSIGISEIEKNFFSKDNQYFVTSLKMKTIYVLEINHNDFQIVDKIYIGERIRDIIYDFNKNVYYIYLEDTPKIMRLSNLN